MKWEYATESVSTDYLDVILSDRDKSGWEFVAITTEGLKQAPLALNMLHYVAADYRLVFRRLAAQNNK